MLILESEDCDTTPILPLALVGKAGLADGTMTERKFRGDPGGRARKRRTEDGTKVPMESAKN